MSHPLLPSRAVHGPIIKLVAAAGSDGPRSGGVESITPPRTPAWDKIEINLARLLGAVWRKLREESALLDFFFVRGDDGVDTQQNGHRVPEEGTIPRTPTKSKGPASALRLDVFDRLLPLLELPGRAGIHAREACLVALSVKDARVGNFVAGQTTLCARLSRSLTARYLALYDTLEELQVAAALPHPEEEGEGGGSAVVAQMITRQQPERAEATFTEALSLFLQHLRFCNAVGLVAADTQACVRPASTSRVSSGDGGAGARGHKSKDSAAAVTDTNTNKDHGIMGEEGGDGVAASLASHVQQLLLGEAIGPALSSALESRAGFAQAIAARTITELSAGVEGYGVAVVGIGSCVGEGGGCRRQLGPLLNTVTSFLIGREGSWANACPENRNAAVRAQRDNRLASAKVGEDVRMLSESTAALAITPAPSSRTDSAGTIKSSGVSLRDTLLRRIDSSSPSLRVSTLQLIASLAELRNDRVLLDLALCPNFASALADPATATSANEKSYALSDEAMPLETQEPSQEAGEHESGVPALRGDRKQQNNDSVEALLSASANSALDGLRVSRTMVDSFGSAFSGSPIHPNLRRVTAREGLEEYIVAAHQRQIQQLMEGARTWEQENEGDKQGSRPPAGVQSEGGASLKVELKENLNVDGGAGEGDGEREMHRVPSTVAGGAGAAVARDADAHQKEYNPAGFVRQYGGILATAADAKGSFIHVLFNCLEVDLPFSSGVIVFCRSLLWGAFSMHLRVACPSIVFMNGGGL